VLVGYQQLVWGVRGTHILVLNWLRALLK
jgi:hypothetical protein